MRKPKGKVEIYLYELLLIYILLLTIANLFLLSIKSFYVSISLILSGLAFLLFLAIAKKYFIFKIDCNHCRPLLILVIFSFLIIRLPPHLYLIGGQDQGTYVNMAQQYLKSHSLYAVDDYRSTLNEDQKAIYDRDGNYMMPSIEKWNRVGDEYSLVFYPGYPSLLSTVSYIFGSNNMVYLLTAFSILSIINMYLITYSLTKSKKASYASLLLIGLNPVHLFFSKYPVGEVVAFTFASSGFYFLLRYFDNKKCASKREIYLIFSTMSFFAFSLTRMTFFTYIPLLFLITVLPLESIKERIILSAYILLNIGVLTFSYIYYKLLLYPLYERIFTTTLGRALGNFIPLDIPNIYKYTILILSIIIYLYFWIFMNTRAFFRKYLITALKVSSALLLFAILKLSINDLNNVLFSTGNVYSRWNILERGFDAIKHVPLFSISNYVSMVGFITFIAAVLINLVKNNVSSIKLICFSALYFTFTYIYKMGLMRYDYYNARYFLIEIIPLIIITISIFISNLYDGGGFKKYMSILLFMLITCYFALFSYFQIGKHEGANLGFYNNVESKIDKDNLIVFINKDIYQSKYDRNFNSYVAGPLKYYYNNKVLVLRNSEEVFLPIPSSIIKTHNKVFFISNTPLENSAHFSNQEVLTLKYNHFNNPIGCNYHNYEFLHIDNIVELPLRRIIECKLLPNVYYERSRDYYFGELII